MKFTFSRLADRVAMLEYGMPDLRDLFDADVRRLDRHGVEPLDAPTLAGGLSGSSAASTKVRRRAPPC